MTDVAEFVDGLRVQNARIECLVKRLDTVESGAATVADFIDDLRERVVTLESDGKDADESYTRLEHRLSVAESAIGSLGAQVRHRSTIGPPKPAESLTELPLMPPQPLPGKVAELVVKWAGEAKALADTALELGPTHEGVETAIESDILQRCADELNRLL